MSRKFNTFRAFEEVEEKVEVKLDAAAVLRHYMETDPIMIAFTNGTLTWGDYAEQVAEEDYKAGRTLVAPAAAVDDGFEVVDGRRNRPPLARAPQRAAGGGGSGYRTPPRTQGWAGGGGGGACGGSTRSWTAAPAAGGGGGAGGGSSHSVGSTRSWTAGPAAGGGGGGAASVHSHHSDHSDEAEECRFFNSPNGCREGADCPYKHVERALSEIPCRFNGTARGCKPAFGKRCPYKH
jgi:hypothetical protein